MKRVLMPRLICVALLLAMLARSASAATYYVDINSPGPLAPYSSWATAATNIQKAVDAASPGDLVLVADGIYASGTTNVGGTSNRVAIRKAITVQSVNGPSVTMVVGAQTPGNANGAIRGFYLASNAIISGFTVTNGSTYAGSQLGGGVFCETTNEQVINCILVSNEVTFFNGGGVGGGTVSNCVFLGNRAQNGGGTSASVVFNSSFLSNNATGNGGAEYNAALINCTITSNTASSGGGGYGGTNLNGFFLGNQSAQGGGAYGATLANCIVVSNSAFSGQGGGAANSMVVNCTVVGNSGGGVAYNGQGPAGVIAVNSVIYSNSPVNYYVSGFSEVTNCQTTPRYGSGNLFVSILTNAPVFVDPANGDYHPQPGSPGYNRGDNSRVVTATDRDGNPRIFGGTVDMGPYEIQMIINTRYVDAHGTNPMSGCINWESAATNLQDALDASVDGDLILVTNGSYQFGGVNGFRAFAANRVTIQSVNGAASTIIDGGNAVSCLFLSTNSVVNGFTLTNGNAVTSIKGGGVWCDDSNSFVLNCVIGGNTAASGGGGRSGTYSNCIFIGNSAGNGGAVMGETALAHSPGGPPFNAPFPCILNNCLLVGNVASNSTAGFGGAAWGSASSNCVLLNCTLIGNIATAAPFGDFIPAGAGGAAYSATMFNCVIASNTAGGGPEPQPGQSGGGGGGAAGCILNQCTIVANSCLAGNGGGLDRCVASNSVISGNIGGTTNFGNISTGGGANSPILVNCQVMSNLSLTANSAAGANGCAMANCLVAGNSATNFAAVGGVSGGFLTNCTIVGNTGWAVGGTSSATLRNCIVVSNVAPFGQNPNWVGGGGSLQYCCTLPLPSSGVGNITNSPLFVDFAGGNFRLQPNSPCINAGKNIYAPAGPDFDGNPRISGGTVDIGAYEFQNPASTISYAWLQQFGLAMDGSADNVDSDGDGLSNYQEWRAGTNPTNAASVLQLPSPTVNGTNLVINWQGVTNINYFLQRSAGLTPSAFQTIATNLAGRNGTNYFTDTNAPPPGPWFYRVGVQ